MEENNQISSSAPPKQRGIKGVGTGRIREFWEGVLYTIFPKWKQPLLEPEAQKTQSIHKTYWLRKFTTLKDSAQDSQGPFLTSHKQELIVEDEKILL